MRLRPRNRLKIGSTESRGKSALPKDWRDSLPDRASRPRRRSNGQLVPIKSEPHARKVRITTGMYSKAIRGDLDQRYLFGRVVSGYLAEYHQHVGEDRSVVQADLCRSAAVHKACTLMSLGRLEDALACGDSEEASAAYEAWCTADRRHHEVARLLGIPRREAPVPDLNDYIARKYGKKKADAEEDQE